MSTDAVLAVIDLEDKPGTTLDRAILVANRLDYDNIDILLCVPAYGTILDGYVPSGEADELTQRIGAVHAEMLDGYAATARAAGLNVSTRVLNDRSVTDLVVEHILESGPSIVVKGTRYHSAAERGALVDSDWQLMRQCPCPLWLVKSESFGESPVVVAAVDPTHANDKPAVLDRHIVAAARQFAHAAGGSVHLLHACEPLSAVGSAVNRALTAAKMDAGSIDERVRAEHLAALQAFAENSGIDPQHTHQLPGRAHEILPAFTRELLADLVVMGVLARSRPTRKAIGNTAERMLDHLPCDVLIVRSDEDK